MQHFVLLEGIERLCIAFLGLVATSCASRWPSSV